ncbi:AMP-dependent synthetase/ligase [Vibrio rumoiensis]|uniref:Long-chain fatty acid--CoA ligase n=1 Tax=Vibrio rumoiensis 1S-45 TaxID=1188252 RepID=A0A1E5E621_9VIBR|nr:long-chain fatty acid--CoA ligase [Vibrio rumoiensis]OEF29173.1 long-chain fatty acid--CoA ligase [Vibrio rumoiensis 1S-45]
MSLEAFHLIRLIQQQSSLKGDAIALEGFETKAPWDQVSWEQLNKHTNKLASVLIQLGVDVQDKCAILSQNCPQWTCVDLAILKARSVVVPLYPTNTLEQAQFILEDSDVKVLFVNDEQQYEMACRLQALVPMIETIVVFDDSVDLDYTKQHFHLYSLLEDDFLIENETNEQFEQRLVEANLSDLVTLIYTSGTTGDPKGVMLDYRNFASTISQHDEILDFTDQDTSLAFLPLSHVFERSWTFYVLSRGGKNVYLQDTNRIKQAIVATRPNTLCVVPRFLEKVYSAIQDQVSKGSKVKQGIFAWALKVGSRQFDVTQGRAKGTPFLTWQHNLADKLVFEKLRNALGGKLKFMPCGGAALDANVAAFFHAINVPVLCGYGMTETTATVTCNTIGNRVTGSNGKPLSGMEIKLGTDNEILIRGETVMRGYYNRPEETVSNFENGWLKTGDAGEFDEEGNLYITDRIKELMKTSNGKYIAPQRVEGKVGCCPFIEQVAIIADAKSYVTALIVPTFESLDAWAKEKGIRYESPLELLRNSYVIEHFEQRLKIMQKELASFEKIKKFTLLPNAFSIEEGLITPTLKLRRKNIYATYSKEIQAMYQPI